MESRELTPGFTDGMALIFLFLFTHIFMLLACDEYNICTVTLEVKFSNFYLQTWS